MSTGQQYTTFFVDRLHFGIEVDRVQEALMPMPTTPVPLTTDTLEGLVNLRGQIVLAIDMRARLDLPRRGENTSSVSLILRTSHGLVSLRVDRLGDVRDTESLAPALDGAASASGWEALPDTVQGPLRELVRGVLKLDGSLLLIVDPDLLADPEICLASDAMADGERAAGTTQSRAARASGERA